VLVIVRHGRTAANAAKLLQGRVDHPLDEVGAHQAKLIAGALGEVDRVISSPLLRARQTAEELGLPIEIDERWQEIDYGDYDGTPVRDVPADVWQRLRSDPDYVPAGGEPYSSLFARVTSALDDLREEARDRMIVVVSHVSPIKVAITWALGVPATAGFRCYLDQASVSRIDVGSNGPVLRSYNEVWHLAP